MRRKIQIITIILGVLTLFFIFNIFNHKKVLGVKVNKQNYIEKILVTGTVQGKNYSNLSSELNGTIREIYKREGDKVKKGEVVAKLDTEEIEKNIAEKKALYEKTKADLESLSKEELKNAKSFLTSSEIAYITSKNEFEKYTKLYEKKYINELEYNNKKNQYYTNKNQWENAKTQWENLQIGGSLKKGVEASLESAKNSWEALEKKYEKHFIVAPFDGYITRRNVEIGESIAPYSEMFQLSSQEDKVVVINLDEKYADRIKVGSISKIYPYGNSEKYSVGKIFFKGIDIDSDKGTLEIKSTIEEQLPEFLYSSTVNAVVEGREIKESFLLDDKFIVYKNNKKFVFILENGKAKLQEVQGIPVIDGFIVTKGIKSEEIILEPKNLESGEKIKVQLLESE